MMQFVIFHGSLGSPRENWFPSLKTKLENMGQTVHAPEFPVDKEGTLLTNPPTKTVQNLESWMKVFEDSVLPNLNNDEEICFVGHSLGNLLILHIIEKHNIKLDCAIFVSPFLGKLDSVPKHYDLVNSTFYKTDFDFENISQQIPTSYTLYSDTDPYVETKITKHFANSVHSSPILVRKADHFSSSVNMNEIPLVFDLCVSRLDLDLYQKYLYKKQLEESVLNLIGSDGKVLEMTPEQLADEGKFHSENLQIGGFATFISNAQDWDPKHVYFEGTRRVAEDGLSITRVIIVKDQEDLKREILKQQIDLDLKAGIDVRLIDYEDVQEIGCEEDFGIWDNAYVCIQYNDEDGNLTGGLLDSRVKSLLTAQNWRDRIMRKSRKWEKHPK